MVRLDAARVTAWRELQAVAGAIERRLDAALVAEWRVPLASFDVLAALQRVGGRTRPRALAASLRLSPSSLSRRLDRLQEEGWVARARRPAGTADHRAVVVELTPRGRALWRAMNVTYRRGVQQLLSAPLEDADVDRLTAVLARLGTALDVTDGPPSTDEHGLGRARR